MAVQLYPHQQEAIDQLANGKILWGDVGTGKSLTAMAYFFTKVCKGVPGDSGSLRTPKDIYIITTAKKRDSLDWEKEASHFNITSDRECSVSGIQLTVDSWNNIGKYEGISGAFFIFDEQRLVGSGAWTKKFLKIAKHNEWILLTATPGDTWLDYIPVFIANGFYRNRTEFMREHVVFNTYAKFPKVDRYVGTGTLVKQRNDLLVHMPYQRHTKRHVMDVKVAYDEDAFKRVLEDRWHIYEERPIRDVAELFLVMRKVVNSDNSRLEAVRRLMQRHPRLIVFYNFDFELKMLRTLAGSWTEDDGNGEIYVPGDIPVAEWNGHKHEPIPSGDRWVYLVQYVAGSEGWNCVSTNATAFYSLTYSYKNYHQAHGRIDRLNTPYEDLYYYNLVSDSIIDKAVMKSLRAKKSFQEAEMRL